MGAGQVIKMRFCCYKDQRILTLAILCLVLCTLSGCAVVGPRSISMGRATYNEAINVTADEQILLAIVKGCYGETFSLLAVSSVAANVSFRVNAGAEVGIGSQENYAGNLVPFSGGVAYEENPTISYVPVQGENYLHQLLSPIPIRTLLLFLRSAVDKAQYSIVLMDRINDMQNPDFLDSPFAKTDLLFQSFVELHSELDKAGVIHWVENPKKENTFNILITKYAPAYSEKVREYLRLLGFPMPTDQSEDIVLPVNLAIKGREVDGIAISTRSTNDLIEILRAAVEIPQEQVSAGLAYKYPPPGLAGKDLHIYASKDKPVQPAVAVKHRGYWFYIDDADMTTKLYFKLVRTMWSVAISSVADQRAAPILTIPVSR